MESHSVQLVTIRTLIGQVHTQYSAWLRGFSDCVLMIILLLQRTPGLAVWTRNTRSWTPIAARTRARLQNK